MSGIENIFIVAATILFGLLFVMWKKNNWMNFFFKAAFLVMLILGILIIDNQHLIF